MGRYTGINSWNYPKYYRGRADHSDPRLAIARQTGWRKFGGEYTDYPTPEPDNFNRAVFSKKPVDCLLVEDQVIFYDSVREGWITVMYVPDEQIEEIDIWIKQFPIYWHHLKAPKIRSQKPILWTRHNISDDNMTDNERLYTLGYYEDLKVKYFNDDTDYVDSLLGEARAVLKNPWPEVEDEIEVEDH